MSETKKVPATLIVPGMRLRVEFEKVPTTEWTVAATAERSAVFTKVWINLQAPGETPRTIVVAETETLEVIQ